MSFEASIRMLLTSRREEPLSPDEWRRVKARCAWVEATLNQWLEAMRGMDDRCMAAVDKVSEDEFNRLFEEEEAKVDAIRAKLDAAIERDEWPRELYWSL